MALLRQMLPDARITGSMLLPRWVWVGARKDTAVEKIRKVVNQKGARMRRALEGRVYPGVVSWCRKCVLRPQRTGAPHHLSGDRPAGGALLGFIASGNPFPETAQPCGVCKASDRIGFSMEIAIDDPFPGGWEAFVGRNCVDASVSSSSWKHLR